MNGGGAGSGDGDACVEGSDLHLVLGIHSLGIVAGGDDVVQDQIQSLHGEGIGEGIGLLAGVALDGVSQSVYAGGSGDLPGQVLDEPCVQDHVVGNHVGVDDANLQFLLGNGHDGVGGDLSAGTGGGGDQNAGNALLGHAGIVQQFLDTVLVGDQNAGQLGSIQNGAAAAGNDHVSAAGLELVNQLLNGHVGRLCGQIVQNVVVSAGSLDSCFGQFKQTAGTDALVGEHGNPLDIVALQNGGYVVHGVLAAEDSVGHLQIVGSKHNYRSCSLFA